MSTSEHRVWQRRLGWLVFFLWVCAFLGSFPAAILTPPSDFGFTAGVNRVLIFFGFQIAAGTLSLIGLVLRSGLPKKTFLRRLLLWPAGLFVAQIFAVVLLYLWSGAV